jgi:c-di-GMP-binding flagellar brake protein YcgR
VTERRRFLRFETALNALCEFIKDKRKASFKIRNISKEGALILIDKKVSEGEELNLSMEVPGDNVPVFASCEVAWQKVPHGGNLYETGVKFKNIDTMDKNRLLEFIYLQWLRHLDGK